MAVISTSFRWLDFLEKEFDKSFVDLDVLLGDFDCDDPSMVHTVRQKLATLSSCFGQLSHKAQTIFQMNAKSEAELLNLREELVEAKSQNDNLNRELHMLLVQLHTTQLGRLDEDNSAIIKQRLESDLAHRSPTHRALITGGKVDNIVISLENWKRYLMAENAALRNSLVTLQAEVCGARLAARYLDKELAGRIQQLQLLGRSDMNTECRDKLWSQLEAEILLQRHKTVQRAVRQQTINSTQPPSSITNVIRTVTLKREAFSELGISVTGGKEHGVPILISELEPKMAQGLYVGDAILSVNGINLAQMTHQEAVDLLNKQVGTIKLSVQYLSNSDCDDDDNVSVNDNELRRLRYGYFSEEDEEKIEEYVRKITSTTPTAPRTPETDHSVSENNISDEIVSDQGTSHEESSNPSKATSNDDYYGVTTLQKIFRSLSPRSSSKDELKCESSKPTETEIGNGNAKENRSTTAVTSNPNSRSNSDSKDTSKLKSEPLKVEIETLNGASSRSDQWMQNSSGESPILTSSSLDCISSDSDASDKRSTVEQEHAKIEKYERSMRSYSREDGTKLKSDNQIHFSKHSKNCAKQGSYSRGKSYSRSISADNMNESKKYVPYSAACLENVHKIRLASIASKHRHVSNSVPENTQRQNVTNATGSAEKSECCSSKRTSVEILSPDDNSNLYRLVESKNDKVVKSASGESGGVLRSRRSSELSNPDEKKLNSVSKDSSEKLYLYNSLNDPSFGTPV